MQQLHTFVAQPDIFIAGAGPAGLACAIAASLQGFTVYVADGMEPPIDKACGEGLMPDSLELLRQLGIAPSSSDGYSIHGIRFVGPPSIGHSAAEAAFPSHPGFGIKRTSLHQLLFERASALGVRFSWKTTVQSVEDGLVRTNRFLIRPRFIVGADGHHSRIAHCAGLSEAAIHSRRIGLRQHYAVAPWSHCVEVYWSDQGQAYITPISSQEICVAFVSNEKFPSLTEALSHFPALQHHLAEAQPVGAPRGALTLGRTLRRVVSGNVALVGDASGSVDAITGEGMGLCFRQALALSQALWANDPAGYQAAHRGIQRLPGLMSRSLLLMDRHPRLRAHVLNAFESHPHLFERLLQLHIGHSPVRFFGADGLLSTGLHLLIA